MIDLVTGGDIDYYMSPREGYCIIDNDKIPLVYIVEVMDGALLEMDGILIHAGVMPGSVEHEDQCMEDVFDHGFVEISLNSINPDSIPFKKDGMGWIVEDVDDALSKAMERADPVFSLIGFYLDRRVNMIGQTGWDLIMDWIGKVSFQEWLHENHRIHVR